MTPRRYGANGSITAAATKTILSLSGSTAVRPALYDLLISSNATPADNSSQWWLLRFGTANGTGTAVTPELLDNADPAAASTVKKNHSAEPTTYGTVPILDVSVNQRATFRWVAAPGSEIISSAAATTGVGLQCQGVGGSGVATNAAILFME